MAEGLGIANPDGFAINQILLGWLILFIFLIPGILTWRRTQNNGEALKRSYVPVALFAYSIFYLIYSHIKKGLFVSAGRFQLEQYLYWVVLIIMFTMWVFSGRKTPTTLFISGVSESWWRWIAIITFVLVFIAVITLISINIHNGAHGYHERF